MPQSPTPTIRRPRAAQAQSLEAAKPRAEAPALVVELRDVRKGDVARVGGKCANLGELIAAGVDVPPGFAVTAQAFQAFRDHNGLGERIAAILAEVKDTEEPQAFVEAAQKVRELVEAAPVPRALEKAIRAAYQRLAGAGGPPAAKANGQAGSSRAQGPADPCVAVRSSATGEDLPEASFAGQQDTYLNVQGADAVVEHVRKCWASLYTARAIFYRQQKGFPHDAVLIAVAVQRMVRSSSAGVLFTLDPVTGDDSAITIESTWGLGEALVSGRVRPDRFVVGKKDMRIVARDIAHKDAELVPVASALRTREQAVPPARREAPSLQDEEVLELARLARRIEGHYGCPQDIEFAVEAAPGGNAAGKGAGKANGHGGKGAGGAARPAARRIFIVQARPETVWRKQAGAPQPAEGEDAPKVVLKGLAAGPGIHCGRAAVVLTPEEAGKKVRKGDILVTRMTTPDWVPYMRLAGAIVTDDGGVTCHAAIVSREMGIPCIVGSRQATKALQDGSTYTVDAKNGLVYGGKAEAILAQGAGAAGTGHGSAGSSARQDAAAAAAAAVASAPVTSTKVYVNLSMPEVAEKVARESGADGIGLLRAEHLMLSVGKHPRLLLEEGGEDAMVNAFAEGIRTFAAAFAPRPVVYRFLDFKPDEFLSLPGGDKYERDAGHVGANPLIGYRGCFRYVKEPDIFRLECKALRKVRDEYGLRNVHAMVPFVRTVREFANAKRLMESEGLGRSREFKLWIMVEVPSTVLMIDRFLQEGLDGVSFGTNDLTMLILGIDRGDASVQEIYDERNPAVLRAMGHVIRACRAAGVTTSVCGQAPSNYPEVVEFLVREGATSLSVNPDKVLETRHLVAALERKMILDGVRQMRPERADRDPLRGLGTSLGATPGGLVPGQGAMPTGGSGWGSTVPGAPLAGPRGAPPGTPFAPTGAHGPAGAGGLGTGPLGLPRAA